MNQKRIEELEAKQLALQEEMEPKRNACIEATNRLTACEEVEDDLSCNTNFHKGMRSGIQESINRLTDESTEKGFRDTYHLEELFKAYGASTLFLRKIQRRV